MKPMKVKELKGILESIDDDATVIVHVTKQKKNGRIKTVGYDVDFVKTRFGCFIFECLSQK